MIFRKPSNLLPYVVKRFNYI